MSMIQAAVATDDVWGGAASDRPPVSDWVAPAGRRSSDASASSIHFVLMNPRCTMVHILYHSSHKRALVCSRLKYLSSV
jgi:hypothetical protein